MAIKRGLLFAALTAALVIIGAIIFFTRHYFSESTITRVAGTPLVQEIYLASKDYGDRISIPGVSAIMYRHIPIGTTSDAAKSFLIGQGFTVRELVGRANGATILATVPIVYKNGNAVGWNYMVALEIIESHDGGTTKIQKIMAKNLLSAL